MAGTDFYICFLTLSYFLTRLTEKKYLKNFNYTKIRQINLMVIVNLIGQLSFFIRRATEIKKLNFDKSRHIIVSAARLLYNNNAYNCM